MWTCVIHAYVVADMFHLLATRTTRCEQHASFLYDTPPESPLLIKMVVLEVAAERGYIYKN